MEGEGGRFRRRHLVPIPVVATIAELNQRLQAADVADDARRIGHRTHTVGEDFAAEQPLLLPLPAERFDAARLLAAHRVDHKARICVRQHHYSVPARFAGRTVGVRLGATFLEVRAGGQLIARHERSVTKGGESLVLDHYLEVLVRKPGALPGATALAQAREQGAFTPTHEAFWTACRRKHGDAAGTRALVEVLLAHRHLPAHALIQAMRQAVDAGVTQAAVVLVEARRIADRQPPAEVIPIGALQRFDRPKPALAGYDALLDGQGTPAGRGQPAEHASGQRTRCVHWPPAPPRGRPGRRQQGRGGGRMKPMTEQAAEAAIRVACRELHLPTIADQGPPIADDATRERLTHRGFLAEVLAAEVDERAQRRKARRLLEAHFPRLKRLEDFDTTVAPGVPPATVAALQAGAFIDAGAPVVLLGDSGTGKSQLLIGMGWLPARLAAGSATSPPRRWSTSSQRPPASVCCRAPWPATGATTLSAWIYADTATMPRCRRSGADLRYDCKLLGSVFCDRLGIVSR